MKHLLILFVPLVLIGCGDGPVENAQQTKLENTLRDINRLYTSGNGLKRVAATEQFEQWEKTQIAIKPALNNFVCSADPRFATSMTLACNGSNGIVYRLNFAEPQEDMILNLKNRQDITFSGWMYGEDSITIDGAIRAPEIDVRHVCFTSNCTTPDYMLKNK